MAVLLAGCSSASTPGAATSSTGASATGLSSASATSTASSTDTGPPATAATEASSSTVATASSGTAPASSAPTGAAAGDSPVVAAAVAECVRTRLTRLQLADRVGQLLVVGIPATAPVQGAGLARAVRAGGVFLHGRSSQSLGVVAQGIGALQASAGLAGLLPLQVTVDQEGGQIQALSGTGFPAMPSAVVQGTWGAAQLRETTRAWATALVRAGVTWNLAPVADTVPAGMLDQNQPIGHYQREYGTTPAAVGDDVATVVQASRSTGLLTTVKHFPGLGRVTDNTDVSATATDPVTTTGDPYLQPFVRGIAAGSSAVMISSASYPRLDANHLAVFSPAVIQGLLRGTLGYDGLVISDDLGMATSVQSVPAGQRAVQFVAAGGDVVLTVRAAEATPMYQALLAAAKGSAGFQARVDRSASRVLTEKVHAGLLPCPGYVKPVAAG